uniref:THH1/TOM1/TOM3 domain-containing protein n=1 Tax=Opuntia streptacantha TaxID=393608 RepID=A0A7C9F126_OPUST
MVGHPPHFSNGDGLVPRRMNLDIEIDSHTNIYGTISAWWNRMMDGNKDWQKGVYLSLCACSAVLALIGLVQLIRIQLRAPDCGWTTQKVFHLMNFIVNGCRALLFGLYDKVSQIRPRTVQIMLVEVPGLLFFSTYTLLLLFWAEIYHQARCLPTDYIRPIYYTVNGAVYIIEIMLWICLGLSKSTVALQAARVVLSGCSSS